MAIKKESSTQKKGVIAKTPITKSTITVETKKISNSETACCTKPCCSLSIRKLLVPILLVLNTLLLTLVLMNQTKIDTLKVGGKENYQLLKQLFETEGYKGQQKQQLEEMIKVLSQPQMQQAAPAVNTAPQANQPTNPQVNQQ